MACTLGKVNRCQNVGKKFQQEISEARYDSIVNASKRRQDGLYNDITKDSLILHRLCASTYTSNFHIEREEKKRKAEESSAERSNKLLRSDAPRSTNGEVFEFGKHCMYCIDVTICKLSNEYSKQAKKEYIREAYPVTIVNDKSGRSYIDVILGKCDERGEELGRIVRRRIESLGGSDLPAAEARYHKVCKTNFFWNFVKEKKQTEDPALLALFDEMSQNRDRIWNSIELQAEYVSLGGHFIHSRNFILNKIQSYFGDTVTVFYALGFSKIVCFKAETTKLLHLTKQEKIDEDDLDLSISRIASRIRSETKYNQEKRESYSIDIDRDIVRKPVSETLLDLLVKVSPKFHDSLQSLMIGNIVTSTLNNGPTDLQIALGVALRRNKTLIQLLYKYGITCSYDEILLFKYSAAIASTKTSTGDIFEKDGKIIHCVADNYDCEIFSQNCKKTCHCLAMILAQTERLHKTLETAQKTIPRQNMKDRYKEVEYEESAKVPFHMPKNPPMPKSVALKVVPSLSFLCRTIISYQKASHEDMQFMKDITSLPECPEWTGYNTKRSRDAGMIPEPKAKVVFRPLINKTPSDPSTLKTAIQSGLTLVKGAGQDILVFTVDMQLYKVVVDMLFYEPSLFKVVVPMCGGMHMLMNFIHAVCVLLSPAIKPILASTFGSVDRMIKGKKYPQNMRALRIIAEEMLCSILDNNPDILTMDQLIKHLDEESQNSKTTKLWVECLIKPVFIMCAFLRAAREQDFALHYAAAKAMLPYFAAAGGVFYARYGTFYVHHLETLPMKIIEKLMHDCALRITPGIFNAIHTDQVIETTYMRLGHGPGGARGIERDDRQIAVWALSFATCGEIVNNLMDMANTKKSNPNNQHKEESVSRILYDQKDRKSIQSYMARIIDPIDPKTHPGGHLINIVSGEIASEKANPQEAVSKGMEMIKKFKDSWPDGFRATLSKPIITMDTKVRFTKIGDNRVYDQSFIYGRTCGLMASNHNINMDDCLVTEMAPNPPAYFTEEGKMRTTTKYILRLALEERLSERLVKECHTLVYDVSAVLWTISWPNEGSTLQVYINTFKAFAITALSTTPHVVFVFDRYYPESPKTFTRLQRQEKEGFSRMHVLKSDMLILSRSCILGVTQNKKQVNKMLSDALLDPSFYKQATRQGHTLTIAGVEDFPIEITNGVKINRRDIDAAHEEADLIIAQQAIMASKEDHTVSVISDDTDVFVLLLYFYVSEKCSGHMYMSSPKNKAASSVNLSPVANQEGRTVIDMKQSAKKHASLSQHILQIHALTGADTVAPLFRIGKKNALNTVTSFNRDVTEEKGATKKKRKVVGYFDPKILDVVGNVNAEISEIIDVGTKFILACYGKQYTTCKDMNEARVKAWRKKITKGPVKLSEIPPTNEAAGENIKRAHLQVAHWLTSLIGIPPDMNPLDYGYECYSTATGSILVPQPLPPGTKDSPDFIREMIHCGCDASQCKGTNCKCSTIGCTLFCKCEAGSTCLNPLTKHFHDIDESQTTEEINPSEANLINDL